MLGYEVVVINDHVALFVLRILMPHLSLMLELVWMKSFLDFSLFYAVLVAIGFSSNPMISFSVSFRFKSYLAINFSCILLFS